MFANVETWSQIKESEYKQLENMQYRILKGMFSLPQCTPYWGIIAESGIWPVRCIIEYKKIRLFQNIIQSEEKRLIKEIVEDQIKHPYGNFWVNGIVDISNKYEIRFEDTVSGI